MCEVITNLINGSFPHIYFDCILNYVLNSLRFRVCVHSFVCQLVLFSLTNKLKYIT